MCVISMISLRTTRNLRVYRSGFAFAGLRHPRPHFLPIRRRASSLPLCGHTRGEALSLWTVSRSHSWSLRRRGSLLVPFARFPAGSESPSLPGICACLTSGSGPLFPGNWSSERWGRHDGHVPGNKRPGAKTFPFRLPQVFCCLLKLSPLGLVAARCKCRSQLDKHKITQVEKFVKGLVYII